MAGSVSIPLVVEIAFGPGPMDSDPLVWNDVSRFVRRSQTISLSRGRDRESGEPTARGQIRFSNPDGRFTLGKVGTYGLVRNRLPIRVRKGATVLWTGLIEKWGQATDAGVRSTVDATLMDRWPRMKQRKLSGDRLLQVCLGLAPTSLWPLTDLAGADRADEVNGWDMLPVGKDALPWSWAAAANPQSGLAAPVVQAAAAGTSLMVTPETRTGGDVVTVSAWVKLVPGGGIPRVRIEGDGFVGMSLFVNPTAHLEVNTDPPSGAATVYLSISGGGLADGWHHLAGVLSVAAGIPTASLYVDGVLAGTVTGYALTWPTTRTVALSCGQSTACAYVATWDRALSASEVAAVTAAGFDALGQTGQTADVRAALVEMLWTPSTVTSEGTFTATMSKEAVDGVSQADLLLACAQAEDGSVHMGTDGWPLLRAKGARTDAALAATIPAAVLSADATWELDDQAVVNTAQVNRMALGEVASTVNRRNEASIAVYDEVSRSVSVWLDSDVQAVDRANGLVNMWGEAVPSSRAFTVDLMTCGAAVSVDTLLGVDIGSRIQVSGLGSVYPAGTSAGYFVDDIADEITESSWRRTFAVSPALDFLVLDDADFGGLDEWPLG